MDHRGIEFDVKEMAGSPVQWRWIVYRRQPYGRVALGEMIGTRDEAIALCKIEIDCGFDLMHKRNR